MPWVGWFWFHGREREPDDFCGDGTTHHQKAMRGCFTPRKQVQRCVHHVCMQQHLLLSCRARTVCCAQKKNTPRDPSTAAPRSIPSSIPRCTTQTFLVLRYCLSGFEFVSTIRFRARKSRAPATLWGGWPRALQLILWRRLRQRRRLFSFHSHLESSELGMGPIHSYQRLHALGHLVSGRTRTRTKTRTRTRTTRPTHPE